MPKPDNTEELRQQLDKLARSMNVYFEDHELDEWVQLITTHTAKARDDELERMTDHWFNCEGDDCEFSEGTHICGYYEHRKAEIGVGAEEEV